MTLEERAACIADKSLTTARGALRRDRIYQEALKMLTEAVEVSWRCPICGTQQMTETRYYGANATSILTGPYRDYPG